MSTEERESTYRDRLAEAMCDKFFCGPPERRDDALKTWRQFADVAVAVPNPELERLRGELAWLETAHEATSNALTALRTAHREERERADRLEMSLIQHAEVTDKATAERDEALAEAEELRGEVAKWKQAFDDATAMAIENGVQADRAKAAIEKAREILPSFEGQITALIDDHPPLAETLSVTYRRLMFALSPGGSEEAQDQCVRIDAEMPGEGPSCVTHNEPWPCPQAGQPAAPYGAIDPGPALDTPTPGDTHE